jgi:hypothetical protein
MGRSRSSTGSSGIGFAVAGLAAVAIGTVMYTANDSDIGTESANSPSKEVNGYVCF